MNDLLKKFENDNATLADLNELVCKLDLTLYVRGFKDGMDTLSKFITPLWRKIGDYTYE